MPGGPGPPPAWPGGSGRPTGRPLLPFPPLLCNRALGSIKNSALQADCNAPSLGSTVWSGSEQRRNVAFRLPQQRSRGAAGRGDSGASQGPDSSVTLGSSPPWSAGPAARPRARQASALPPVQGFPLSPVRLPELPPARSRSAGCLPLEQKQRKGTLEGSETLHLAPEVALQYLYFFLLLFSF